MLITGLSGAGRSAAAAVLEDLGWYVIDNLPTSLVDMEIQRLMQAARQDMEQRGMKVKDMPMQPEWFADQAKRRVTLGLILAEVVKTEKLQATPEQVRALLPDVWQPV